MVPEDDPEKEFWKQPDVKLKLDSVRVPRNQWNMPTNGTLLREALSEAVD